MSSIGLLVLVLMYGAFIAFVAFAKENTTKMALLGMWAILFLGLLWSLFRLALHLIDSAI